MGSAPGSTNTGPAVDRHRHVARRRARPCGAAARVTMSLPCLTREVASTAGCAAPKRTVPRTMTSVESVRRSTGTVMGAGCGAAVSAATWAGERICRAAAQPTTARATSAATASGRDAPVPERPSSSLGGQPTLPAATQMAKTEKLCAAVASPLSTWPVQARPPASG